MNLLFDQNISFKIIKKIEDLFPESKQVRILNLENKDDFFIWQYARQNNFCIVTFDSDFIDISTLKGFPPKIIWLRTGNNTTNFIADKIREHHSSINDFLLDNEAGFLEIY